MIRKRPTKVDPIEQEIELALNPGAFISDGACFSFVSDLDEVAAKMAKLTTTDPSRAVALYETFLAACYAKIEELDDSSGSFGQFVSNLYCGWIRARQAEGANPDDTASRLLAWMDNDDYGFCYHLEKDAAKVFNKANLAAFVTQVRARFDAAADAQKSDDVSKDRSDYIRRHFGEILRTLYAAQKDVAAYVGDGVSEREALGADFDAVLRKAALLNAAVSGQRAQALFLQNLADGVVVEELDLSDGGRTHKSSLLIELRTNLHAAGAGNTVGQRIADLLLLREETKGVNLEGLTQELYDLPAGGTSCDLSLYLTLGKASGLARFEYNRNLFEKKSIRRMAGLFLRYLKKIGANYTNATGTLESSTFDTGTNATNYTILSWQPVSQSASTTLVFQVAPTDLSVCPTPTLPHNPLQNYLPQP